MLTVLFLLCLTNEHLIFSGGIFEGGETKLSINISSLFIMVDLKKIIYNK